MDEQISNNLNHNAENLGEALTLPEYVFAPKKEVNFTKAERIMAFVTAVLAFFFVHLVLWNVQGFFTTAFYIAVITAAIVFMCKSGRKFKAFHKVTAAVLYIFSFVFSVTANELIKGLDVVFLFCGGAYLVYSVCSEGKSFGRFLPIELVKSVFEYPFANFGMECKAINSAAKKSKLGSNAKLIIAGFLVALPLTLAVAALLMSADSGVERILIDLADFIGAQNVWTLLIELALSIPAGCYLFSMLFSNTHRNDSGLDESKCENLCNSARKINNIVIYSAVTPICLLYGLFFASQINYFTSAFMGRLPSSYSYAEYARKGFFELFAISVINACVILFISFCSKNSGRNKPKALKFYTVLISVFTLLITATAISKMVMYIQNYGLTQLRVYTTWFMTLIALMFVYVIIRQFKPDFGFMTCAAVTFTLMFALLCFSRPDAIIARYNLEYCADSLSYNDILEMKNLSNDAVAVILDDSYASIVRNAIESRNISEEDDFRSSGIYEYQTYDSYESFVSDILAGLDKDPYAEYNLSAILIRSRAGNLYG